MISMVSYMLHTIREGADPVRILCDDTDVFASLVYFSWKCQLGADIQFQKWDYTILSINDTVASLGAKCKVLLAAHTLSGCDTTSFPFCKGKTMTLNVL